jgi:hypothetical protein
LLRETASHHDLPAISEFEDTLWTSRISDDQFLSMAGSLVPAQFAPHFLDHILEVGLGAVPFTD